MKTYNRNIALAVFFVVFFVLFTGGTIINLANRAVEIVEEKNNGIREEIIDVEMIEISQKVEEEITGIKKIENRLKSLIAKVEDFYTAYIFKKQEFIELNGYAQKLLNKQMVNDLIMDNQGFMQEISKLEDMNYPVNAVVELRDYVESMGAKYLYVQPMSKVIEGYNILPYGTYDFSNQNISNFIKGLDANGVPNINLTNYIDDMYDINNIYFKTDHHWSIETAFQVYTTILKYIQDNYDDINMDFDLLTDKDNFNFEILKQNFLGSQGLKVGASYSGLDDFAVISPKFETDIELSQIINGKLNHQKNGNYLETILYPEYLEVVGKYSSTSYGAYTIRNNAIRVISNKSAQNDKKLLVIGDSFSEPVASFLSLGFAETRSLSPQEGRGANVNIYKYINDYNPDVVINLFYEKSLNNRYIFDFKKH